MVWNASMIPSSTLNLGGSIATGIAQGLQAGLRASQENIDAARRRKMEEELYQRRLAEMDYEATAGVLEGGDVLNPSLADTLGRTMGGRRGGRAAGAGLGMAAGGGADAMGVPEPYGIATDIDQEALRKAQALQAAARARMEASAEESGADLLAGTPEVPSRFRGAMRAIAGPTAVEPAGTTVGPEDEEADMGEAPDLGTALAGLGRPGRGAEPATPEAHRALAEQTRATADAATSRAAVLPQGIENPAVEFGLEPDQILSLPEIQRAVLQYKRTGDATALRTIGSTVPSDVDGLVGRVSRFNNEVRKRQIEDFQIRLDSQMGFSEKKRTASVERYEKRLLADYGDVGLTADEAKDYALGFVQDIENGGNPATVWSNGTAALQSALKDRQAEARIGQRGEEARKTKAVPSVSTSMSDYGPSRLALAQREMDLQVLRASNSSPEARQKAAASLIGTMLFAPRASASGAEKAEYAVAIAARDEAWRYLKGLVEGSAAPSSGAPVVPTFKDVAELAAAKAAGKVRVGDRIVVGGVSGKVQ